VVTTHGFNTGNVSSDHAHAYTASNSNNVARAGLFLGANSGVFGATTGGINANHFHGGTTFGINQNHIHFGSTDNGSSQTNWSPKYIDMILCYKN
jgi:hypothetical protein